MILNFYLSLNFEKYQFIKSFMKLKKMIIEKNKHTTEKTHPTIETIDRAVSHHEQPVGVE